MRWQKRTMSCVMVTSALLVLGPLTSAWAKKPPKPPADDGGTAMFAAVDMGTLGGTGSKGEEINNQGQVVGHSGNADGDGRAFLLTPEDSDGDGNPDTWFRDDEAPFGINDLMIDLGILGMNEWIDDDG